MYSAFFFEKLLNECEKIVTFIHEDKGVLELEYFSNVKPKPRYYGKLDIIIEEDKVNNLINDIDYKLDNLLPNLRFDTIKLPENKLEFNVDINLCNYKFPLPYKDVVACNCSLLDYTIEEKKKFGFESIAGYMIPAYHNIYHFNLNVQQFKWSL